MVRVASPWRSPRQHNHNYVLVSSSCRADDVPAITRERRRECPYVTIGPLYVCESHITHKLDVVSCDHGGIRYGALSSQRSHSNAYAVLSPLAATLLMAQTQSIIVT